MTAPFVGRTIELGHLRDALGDAEHGRGAFVAVSGPGGIGKTRLVDEVARAADGFDIYWIACGPRDATPPFWPWVQIVREILARDGDLASRQLRDFPHLGALWGAGAPESEADALDRNRASLFADVVGLLSARALTRPILVIFDDLHDADRSSHQLLEHVAAAIRTVRIVILATWRSASGTASGLAAVARRARVLAIPPLSADDVDALVAATTPTGATREVADAVHRRSSGNPLVAHGLLAVLHTTDGWHDPDAVEQSVPDSVQAMVNEQLAALLPAEREVVETAAVLGTTFAVDVLGACCALDPIECTELLSGIAPELVSTVDPRRGAFAHDIVRDAVCASLGSARRGQLHAYVADVLLELSRQGRAVEPAELAGHYVEAGPSSSAQAVHYSRVAGDRAMGILAYETAVTMYEQALRASSESMGPTTVADRSELLLAIGDAKTAAGDRTGARAAYLDAANAGQRAQRWDLVADSALGLGEAVGFEVPLFDQEQIGLLELALDRIDIDDTTRRAALTARLSVAVSFVAPAPLRAQLSEEALTEAEASDDERALAYALSARCDALAGPDHSEERVSLATSLVAVGRRLRDVRFELLGHRHLVVCGLEQGDTASVDREVRSFATLASGLGQPIYGWYVPLWHAMRAFASGRVADAWELLERAVVVGEEADSFNAWNLTMTLRWFMHAELANWTEVEEIGREFDPEAFGAPWAYVTQALLTAQTGDPGLARAQLDAIAPQLPEMEHDSEWLPTMAQVAEAVGLVGGHAVAEWTYAAMLPHRARFAVEGIGAAARGPVERDLGVLAAALGRDEVEEHFDAALRACERAGASLNAARTLRDAGIALNDPTRLRDARERYRAMGIANRVTELDVILAPSTSSPDDESAASATNLIRREGDLWHLQFAGTSVRLRDSKGLQDLAALVRQPGTPIPAVELATQYATTARGVTAGDLHTPGDLGEVIDERARAQYRERLVELDAEIDAADAAVDPERSIRAAAERDALVAELAGAYGLDRRPRRAGDPVERARSTVTARIRDAIGRIEAVHPALGAHFDRSIRTGRVCVYEPEIATDWAS